MKKLQYKAYMTFLGWSTLLSIILLVSIPSITDINLTFYRIFKIIFSSFIGGLGFIITSSLLLDKEKNEI